jgi:hypothetical protein
MTKLVTKFNTWQLITEKKASKLNVKEQTKAKKAKKASRKKNKRSNRKEKFVSDSGAEYTLIKQRSQSGDKKHTFVLKGKGKDSPVWDEDGVIMKDVNTFLENELESGENKGKYDIDTVKLEKYREGKNKDRVKFSVELGTTSTKKEDSEEVKTKTPDAIKITLPENEEGEKRINVGDTSKELLKIKELIRTTLVPAGLKLGADFEIKDWLDKEELEEKDVVWIKMVRSGLDMEPADFISQGMVDKLIAETSDMKSTNESIMHFDKFLQLNEAFDMSAANKTGEKLNKEKKVVKKKPVTKSSDSTSTEDSGEETVGDSGLTDTQAAAYRTWANSDDKLINAYGKVGFDLDATGTNNNFVKRSYEKAKADYESGEGNDNMLKKVWASGKPNAWRAKFEKITGIAPEERVLGENEYDMGYISKSGDRWAVHFASPRPPLGTVKKGDNVNIKNAWTEDEEKTFNVADIWKDSNGDIGAIYLSIPDLNLKLAKEEGGTLPLNRDYEGTGIIKVVTLASGGSELRQQMQNDYNLAESISNKLVKFWTGSGRNSVFAPYKGTFNDDEDAALAGGYKPWLRTSGINDELAKIITPYYKKTMQGVIAKTQEEMTDMIGNSVSWSLFDPSKVPNAEDEGLIALAKHEPLASTWVGSSWDQIGSNFSKMLGTSPQMTKHSIPGGYFDF